MKVKNAAKGAIEIADLQGPQRNCILRCHQSFRTRTLSHGTVNAFLLPLVFAIFLLLRSFYCGKIFLRI
jgi:hypothetical protein